MKLTYYNLINIFTREFPEICKNREKEINDLSWEIQQNCVYAFYEEIVKPSFLYLLELEYRKSINEDVVQSKSLVKLLEFFEKMACSDDASVNEVLQVAIFEFITVDVEMLKFLHEILSTESKLVFEQSLNYRLN